MAYDPIFRARMPDPYFDGQNFGAPGVNPASQGWNVNSAYLTPTFMAGYRPNYAGPSNFQSPYMGFWRGMNNAMPTPFQPDVPYYMSPQQYRSSALHAATTGASDAYATAMQFIGGAGVALAVQGASQAKIWRGLPGMGSSNAAWGEVKAFGHALTGGSANTMAMARSTQLPLEALGRGAGSALGRGAGWAASGVINSGARMLGIGGRVALGGMGASMGAFAGAAIGGVVAPFVVGMAAAEAVNKAVFSPYMYGRQAADTFREAYEGQFLGQGTGYSPLGMSSRQANKLGFEVSRDFINNMSFSGGAGAQIASFGMQAGLYSDIKGGGHEQIKKRTRDIAEQVKVVMQIFNEPSMQGAIEMLGKMATQGGAKGLGDIVRVSQAFKQASALTGTSTQQLMNTVGQQGQFMFGQQGMLPYLGQLSALNAYTGISSAFKSGLVSSNALAMMGGREGATQSIMQAQLGMARSPYNQIMAFNQYYGNGTGGGIVGNLSTFGNTIANDPMKALGRFFATQNMSVSDQLAKDPNAFMKQVFQMLDQMPGAKNKNGKYNWESIMLDFQNRGMDPNQANALMSMLREQGNPDYMKNVRGTMDATRRDFLQGNLEKEGLLYGGIGEVPRWFKRIGKSIQSDMSERWQAITDVGAGIGEAAENLIFGISRAELSSSRNPLEGGKTAEEVIKTKGIRRTSTSIAGGLTSLMHGRDDMLRLGNASAGSEVLKNAIKKVGGGAKIKDLTMEERGQLRSYVSGSDGNIEMVTRNFYNMQKDGSIVVNSTVENSSELTEVYKSAVNYAYTAIDERLGEQFGGKTSDAVIKGMKGLKQEDWDSLLAFAVQKGGAIESKEDFLKALGGAGRIGDIFKKAGITDTEQMYQTFLAISGTTVGNKEARMLGMAGDISGKRSRLDIAKGIISARGTLDSVGFRGTNSAAGAGRLSAGALRASQLGMSEDITKMGQAQSAAAMSGGIDFSGFEMAVGRQVEAANTMERASLYMLAASGSGRDALKKLGEDPNMEVSLTQAGLGEYIKK